jgi:predicted Rdx family selenoprotein
LAAEMIEEYGDDLEAITLVRGGKGRFEVTVDGEEIYSKARTKRHAEPGEVVGLMKEREIRIPEANTGDFAVQ